MSGSVDGNDGGFRNVCCVEDCHFQSQRKGYGELNKSDNDVGFVQGIERLLGGEKLWVQSWLYIGRLPSTKD